MEWERIARRRARRRDLRLGRAGRARPRPLLRGPGPRFLIEYDNTQNGANHIHAVWRDLANDWGEDLLAAHYRTGHTPPPSRREPFGRRPTTTIRARRTPPRRHERVAVDQRELVERAQRGDHDAFAVLAGVFVARLDAAARLILRDHELARDAVQEGFIRAWKNLPTLRDPDRFEGWLRSLVFRSCIDVLRRRGRRPIEVELPPVDGPAGRRHRRRSSPTATCSTWRSGACTPEQRAVVVLHYYLGMPLPDVAATLGIPIGTAKSRHHRSLAAMRAAIDADPDAAASPVAGGQLA